MKKFTQGDFEYIKFDSEEEILEFAKTVGLILFADKEKNLYCFNYMSRRTVRFDIKLYKWVIDKRTKIEEFENFEQIDRELANKIYKSIPPFECFNEYDDIVAKETLEYYEKLRKETPRKVIGWLSDVSRYEPAYDEKEYYTAALLNDIIEHKYFFVAEWMSLIPVFDDGTYLELSSRAMGFVIGLSRGEAKEFDYVDYAFGEPFFFKEDDFFNKPKEGLY